MHVVVFLAGYIGKKIKKSVACGICVATLVSADAMTYDTTAFSYLEILDRGGLNHRKFRTLQAE